MNRHLLIGVICEAVQISSISNGNMDEKFCIHLITSDNVISQKNLTLKLSTPTFSSKVNIGIITICY